MADLQVYDARERVLVSAADTLLTIGAAATSPFRRRTKPSAPRQILLLRLERIGDLVMTLPAIAAVRALALSAHVDLVGGSWNAQLAAALPSVDAVETLDAQWLARDGGGRGVAHMLKHAARWRRKHYDLAINFEPDVRSNLLIAASGATWAAGYRSGGGGALLDEALDYDPAAHTTDNAKRLVETVFGTAAPAQITPLIEIPEEQRQRARALLRSVRRPLVAMQVSGGRPVKQWDPARFGDVARRLVAGRGAAILLTGSAADRPLIDQVTRLLPAGSAIDATGEADLLTLGALLDEAELLITGDTGPMHIAAAVGTPIVAVFGASDPRRYAPRGALDRVVRVDLPCAPCNRIRLPPARCTGIIPDCLALISPDRVLDAAIQIIDQRAPRRGLDVIA
ncbi:MAG: glycosyltransferase family 9 protein [Vicinamibacterales bacterium]